MQPAAQFSTLAAKYDEHTAAFGERFTHAEALEGCGVASLGARLEQVAKRIAAEVHPFDETAGEAAGEAAGGATEAFRAQRTLIHGDPKAANIFVRQAAGGGEGGCEVGLIDFQWCGFGLAATDVAHHICAALAPECLSADGTLEEALLDHYHRTLCDALSEHGVAPSAADARAVYPREALQTQYEAGVLDMCRLVFSYQWSRADFDVDAPNKNAYNKSLRNAVWLAARCDALLRRREA